LREVYQAEFKFKAKKEKDLYKLLKDKVFAKSVKLYSTVFKGFPDFIVVSLQEPFSKYLSAGFYEVKLVQKPPQNFASLLSPYQKKAFEFLSEAFPCYLVVGVQSKDEDSLILHFLVFHTQYYLP
jgi:hypothetical protein